MISDFQTSNVYLSPWLKKATKFKPSLDALLKTFQAFKIPIEWIPQTKDYWVRDFLPIPVNQQNLVSYNYQPNYLKNKEEYQSCPQKIIAAMGLASTSTDINLDGGNVVKSSSHVILTDKIFIENPKYTKSQIIQKLECIFQTDKICIIPWDKNDVCGHADGMLRFVNEDTVLIQGYYLNYPDEFLVKLKSALKQSNLKTIHLQYNQRANLTNWAYLNFLQTKDIIIIPSFGKKEDEKAFIEISSHFLDYSKSNSIVQIPLHYIHQYGGAFNCISWTI
jgi:agmatine/peptidylarginine deiminase